MVYFVLLTFLLPLVLGISLYFVKFNKRTTKNIIIGSTTGLVFILNVCLAFFKGKINLFNIAPTLNVGFMIDRLGSFFAIAISIVYQAKDHTLKDDEILPVHNNILLALQKDFAAELRK